MFTLFNKELASLGQDVITRNRSFFNGDWTKNELETYQLNQIKETLRYVKNNSKFYEEKLSILTDFSISNITLNSFEEIPFTDKNDLRNSMFDILSKPVSKACYFYETTGTTGAATPCPRDYVDSIYSNTPITLCYETILKKGDKEHIVGLSGPTELHSFGDSLGDICKNLGLSMAKMWPNSPVVGYKKALETLNKLQISVLMCTPGMALSLLKAAKQLGYDIEKDFHLEILMLTGELGSKSMMKNIENLWGAKAYNFLYGSQETLVLSAAVDDGQMHIFPLNYFYEVIDPNTLKRVDIVNDVQEGELVVTMLFQGSKPLVRYRTGDLVRIYSPKEINLFASPTIEVLGRIRDQISLNNDLVMAYDLEELLMSNLKDCLGYQITITEENGIDQLFIEIENANDTLDFISLEKIAELFENTFKTPTKVIYSSLGKITTTGAMVSWKAARIIDKRVKDIDNEKQSALQIASEREEFGVK